MNKTFAIIAFIMAFLGFSFMCYQRNIEAACGWFMAMWYSFINMARIIAENEN